jgi:ADP-ribose pyrophosphatase
MKFLTLFSTFILGASLFASAPNTQSTTPSVQKTNSLMLDSYFEYLDTYPETLGPDGKASLGEIEIVRDRQKIAEIQQMTGRQVGVVAKDNYWIWLNDPVKFPNSKYGVYGRLLWRSSLKGPAGVAVMAILPDGKIPLNRNFRHATRSWEYELPRGARDHNESIEAAALREVKEETGMVIDSLVSLGEMIPDSGLTNSVVPIFLAKVVSQEDPLFEDSEAIADIDAFSVEELKQGFINGYLSVKIDEKICKIKLRDPFLAFALLQAELRSLLPKDKSKK